MTQLIPRRVFFSDPDRTQVQISPDGRHISYLAPFEGVLNLWIAPDDNVAAASPITRNRSAGILKHAWAYDNHRIIYLQDFEGNEKWNVYLAHIDGDGRSVNLTPDPKVNARLGKVSRLHPDSILVLLNDRDPRYHDVYRIELSSGTRALVLQHPETIDGQDVAGFEFDDDLQLRFAVAFAEDGGQTYHERTPDGGWRKWIDAPLEDTFSTSLSDFDQSGQKVYFIDSRGRNTAAVTLIDSSSGALRVIAQDEKADPGQLLIHSSAKTPIAVSFNYLRPTWQVIDPSFQPDFDALRALSDDDMEVISRSTDERRWIVAFSRDTGPTRFYLYDRVTRAARFLFNDRDALTGIPLCPMRPLIIESRDGLELVCYLTLPADASPDARGRPASPQPMILFVHGGPAGRDRWRFHPMHQWFANRGYAVLSVNFRGSTGLGKELITAATRQWGAKMHDDLIDAVRWAIAHGVADPKRIAIMGGSYGGYASLVGLTFTPDVFACAVAACGPSSLCTLLDSAPPYWKPALRLWHAWVGDHTTAEGRTFLESRSPLTYVDRITRPLLIGQGANDPRVKKSESDQIVRAMQAKNIPVTYVLYPDEGHGFVRPQNELSFHAVVESFLARHLGGRTEPVGSDLYGSSITVPAGLAEIPGISAALDALRNVSGASTDIQ